MQNAPVAIKSEPPKPEGSMVREWLAGSAYNIPPEAQPQRDAEHEPVSDEPPPSKAPASLRTMKADAAGTVLVSHVVAVDGPRIGPPGELIDEKKSYVREWLVGTELQAPGESASGDVVSWLGGSEESAVEGSPSEDSAPAKTGRSVPKPPRPQEKLKAERAERKAVRERLKAERGEKAGERDAKKAEREAKKAEREAKKVAKQTERANKEAEKLARAKAREERRKDKRKQKKERRGKRGRGKR
jgi:hypothetical protein